MIDALKPRIRFGQLSLFGKCLCLIAVVTALVAGLVSINAATLLRNVATQGLQALAFDSTDALANEVSGAIKFGKKPVVEAAFATIAERQGGKLAGGTAFDLQMEPVATFGALAADAQTALVDLGQKALQSGQIKVDASGLLVAAPAIFGDKAAVAGVVVLQWSTDELQAGYGAKQTRAYLTAALLFTILLAIGAWFLHRALRVPMQQVADAMTVVANADFVSTVPLTDRGDEIGRIAQSLDVMRHSLQMAEGERQERERDAEKQDLVVRALSVGLRGLAAGDLTARISGEFPLEYKALQDDFDAAMEKIGDAIRAVVVAAARIGNNAGVIYQQSEDLSQRTENQAAALEETAAAIHELIPTCADQHS